ncbi:MAG: hypothetical protein KJO96_04245 [Winogradskyella sp.]|nr:hypothetical protein [Winogradskyella sp.]NNF86005.1 hypothetical protein [Winogradskyella sp.]
MRCIKILIITLCFNLLTSCSEDAYTKLETINGYWEIEKVVFPNGETKEYKYNDLIDYININDSLKGFRKKLRPSLDGSFSISKDVEGITAKVENDSLNLYYKTPYSQWKETVLFSSENQLKILNQNNNVYFYKRYKALEINLPE